MVSGSNKVSLSHKEPKRTSTAIGNILLYTNVANEIGMAQGWSAAQIEALCEDMLVAIRNRSLQTRNKLTGIPNKEPLDTPWHLVHPDDVNEWLERQGLDYRWVSPNIRIPAVGVESVVSLGSVTVETSPLRLPIVAEPAVGAPVIQRNMASVPSQQHSTKTQRRDSITPVIELAQKGCRDPQDTAEVWAALQVLANNKHPPLLRTEDNGIAYLYGDGVKIFTRDALDKRLHPEKRGKPGKRR
jgi:hypothetical protein